VQIGRLNLHLAIRAEATDTLRLYPDPQASALRDALATYHQVRPEQVFVGNGSDEVLAHAFAALLKHDAPLLFPDITYSFYPVYCRLFGIDWEAVPLDQAMQIRVADYDRPAGALILPNPNAPTGVALSRAEIAALLEQHPDAPVVIDEAYAEFAPGVSVVKLIREYPQLFVARTFSKVAGLASLRLGAVIANRDSLNTLRRATAPFPVNLAALVAAVAAVNDRKTMNGYLRDIARTRKWFEKELHALGVATYPSQCNFLLTSFGPAGPALFERLTRDGVMLRDRAKDIGPGVARISVGTQPEMERLIRKIKRYWKR